MKDKLKYYTDLKNKIGITGSLKTENENQFKEFVELFKTHPDYPKKVEGLTDICIKTNELNHNYLEVNMIKGNLKEDISIKACCRKSPYPKNYNLKRAMRDGITQQIVEFRSEHYKEPCQLCGDNTKIEIDHYNPSFEILSNDFIKITNLPIPEEFDDNFYNAPTFKKENEEFRNSWFLYHKNNSNLRCLCQKCNSKNK